MYVESRVRKIAERAMKKYNLDCDIDDIIQDVYLSKLEGKRQFKLGTDDIRKYQAFEPYEAQLDNRHYNIDEDRLCVVFDIQSSMQHYRPKSEKRRIIIHKRINEELALEEIAKEFGVSRNRIRQIELRELRILAKHLCWNGINRQYYLEVYGE